MWPYKHVECAAATQIGYDSKQSVVCFWGASNCSRNGAHFGHEIRFGSQLFDLRRSDPHCSGTPKMVPYMFFLPPLFCQRIDAFWTQNLGKNRLISARIG